MAEVTKLITCIFLVFNEEGTFVRFKSSLYNAIIKNKVDTLKMTVPSFIYVIQNNLLYLSASHLDAATYQVSNMYGDTCVVLIEQLDILELAYA